MDSIPSSLTINGSVVLNGASGNDPLGTLGVSGETFAVNGAVYMDGDGSNNALYLKNVTVHGNMTELGGLGDDTISNVNDAILGNQLVDGGPGSNGLFTSNVSSHSTTVLGIQTILANASFAPF
jgi:hypothetical protein